MSKNKRKAKANNLPIQQATSISHEELQHIIAKAIIEAETIKNQNTDPIDHPKLTIKSFFKIMFKSLKKLNPQNGTFSLVQTIVSPICVVIKWIGYISSALLFFWAILTAIFQFSIKRLVINLLFILFATSIWMLARLFGAASIEIEQTNSSPIVYNFASFLLAFIAIIISIIGLR